MDNKWRDDISITDVPNGIILPRKMGEGCPMWGWGGVCDADNAFVDDSYYDGGWATQGGSYTWTEEEYMDCDVVYIGLFFKHWGHFLIDLSTRLWGITAAQKEHANLRIAYIGEEEPSGNYLRLIELSGADSRKLIRISKPTRFRHVYVPQQAFKSCEWVSCEYRNWLDAMVDCAEHTIEAEGQLPLEADHPQKVYFSRRSFSKAVQSEFGEAFFEALFLNNGYRSIAPESLTLEQQIYIWNHAEAIVCINGTIPLNVMFSRKKDLKVVILNKTSIFHENPYILFEMRGLSAVYIDIFKEPVKGYPKSLGEGPYLLWPTQSFSTACREQQWEPETGWQKRQRRYFIGQEIRYFWCILGLKKKIRAVLSRMVPEKIKNYRRMVKKWN